MTVAQTPDTNQPTKLMLPKEESVAGNMKIAEAIILPITNDVLVQIPILPDLDVDVRMIQARKSKCQIQNS